MAKQKKLKRDFIICLLILAVCIVGYAAAVHYWVVLPTATLRNWDAGICSVRSRVCEDFYYYDDPEGPGHDRWYFVFTDGSKASITANVRTGFDEDGFRQLLGKELDYVFAEPEAVLMGIRSEGTELLDAEYMRHWLLGTLSGSLFAVIGSCTLMLFMFTGITIWAWVLYSREKKKV